MLRFRAPRVVPAGSKVCNPPGIQQDLASPPSLCANGQASVFTLHVSRQQMPGIILRLLRSLSYCQVGTASSSHPPRPLRSKPTCLGSTPATKCPGLLLGGNSGDGVIQHVSSPSYQSWLKEQGPPPSLQELQEWRCMHPQDTCSPTVLSRGWVSLLSPSHPAPPALPSLQAPCTQYPPALVSLCMLLSFLTCPSNVALTQ